MRCRMWLCAFVLLPLFASTGLAQKTRAGWRPLIPKNELAKYRTAEFYALEFLNHNVGWAVGGHATATIIYHTADGGETWERLTTFDGEQHVPDFTDIEFADANNGWMVGTYHILRTSDGGESWEPVDYGKNAPWAKALLVLGPDAVIIGTNVESKQIARTLNGGKTWEHIELYAHSNTEVSGLAYSTTNSTVFASVGRSHGNYGAIQRSNDGGRTWEVVAEANKPLFDIEFKGKAGVAVGENIAFWTNDGGENWKRTTIPGWQHGVDFIDEQNVVAVGSRPHTVVSSNGGKTWRPIPSPDDSYTGSLAAIDVVDAGWWFVAGGALSQFVDPEHLEPLETGTLPVPVDIVVGDEMLPRGTYEVTLGHQGDDHVIVLEREGDVPEDAEVPKELEKTVEAQENQKPPTCEDPCSITIPVDVTYEKEEVATGKASTPVIKFSLQPTATGVAVVAHAVVTPPRNFALALAAAGMPTTSTVETRDVAQKAKKGGGLFDRIKKAASGDLKGATAGANPEQTTQRVQAAKAAPPASYEITVRHSIRIFSRKNANENN